MLSIIYLGCCNICFKVACCEHLIVVVLYARRVKMIVSESAVLTSGNESIAKGAAMKDLLRGDAQEERLLKGMLVVGRYSYNPPRHRVG